MFSKALGSWLYQIGAFAAVLITWALILVRPPALGFYPTQNPIFMPGKDLE